MSQTAGELRLDGQVAVVTGAGRGIGRAHAHLLAARGAAVVVNDLGGAVDGTGSSTEPATTVAAEIVAAGGQAIANAADVSTEVGAESAVFTAIDHFGGLDIVVTNAGVIRRKRPLPQWSLADFEQVWRHSAGATIATVRAAWPHLVRQGYGRVVTTTSTAGLYGQIESTPYSSAKAAVYGFTRALALESAAHGIRVNAIGPGGWTRMLTGIVTDPAVADELQTVLRPELSSPPVIWLAHESCPVNGQVYQVHGGRAARVFVGEPDGYWDPALTPESFRDELGQIEASGPLTYFHDSYAHATFVREGRRERDAVKGGS